MRPFYLEKDMINKKELRILAKDIRKKLDISTISEKIIDNFVSSSEYEQSLNILAYHSFSDEVNTHALFKKNGKNWFIPRINEDDLEVCLYEPNLSKNKFGILEPRGVDCQDPSIIDLVILPALMVDKRGHRLGYGKGFYDRFLSQNCNSINKVVFIPEELFVETIYPEAHDCAVNLIITQCNIYRI